VCMLSWSLGDDRVRKLSWWGLICIRLDLMIRSVVN
jgi:hypothetical protein